MKNQALILFLNFLIFFSTFGQLIAMEPLRKKQKLNAIEEYEEKPKSVLEKPNILEEEEEVAYSKSSVLSFSSDNISLHILNLPVEVLLLIFKEVLSQDEDFFPSWKNAICNTTTIRLLCQSCNELSYDLLRLIKLNFSFEFKGWTADELTRMLKDVLENSNFIPGKDSISGSLQYPTTDNPEILAGKLVIAGADPNLMISKRKIFNKYREVHWSHYFKSSQEHNLVWQNIDSKVSEVPLINNIISVAMSFFCFFPKLIPLLIQYGAEINSENNDGYRPVILAALPRTELKTIGCSSYPPQLNLFKSLLKVPTMDINAKNSSGCTPLMIIARYSSLRMLSEFLKYNPDIFAQDNNGCTALMTSVMGRQDQDNPKSKLNMLLNYLQMKCSNIRTSPQTLINLQNSKGMTALMLTVRYSEIGSNIKLLLEHKADIDLQDLEGNTALHFASQNGESITELVLLLEHKANAFAKNNRGETPLFFGIKIRMQCCSNILEKLVEHLAHTVNCQNNVGDTILMEVAQTKYRNYQQLIKILLKAGADVNITNNRRQNVISIALPSRRKKIKELIAEYSSIQTTIHQ